MVTARAGSAVAVAGSGYAYASAGGTSAWAGSGWFNWWKRKVQTQIKDVTKDTRVPYIPEIKQYLHFQFQSTNFTKLADEGEVRVVPTGTISAINEETNAQVIAYATFDDVGGKEGAGAGTTSPFDSSCRFVPLTDNENRTANYHGHPRYIEWETSHPSVTHTKQFMLSHSLKLNIPGIEEANKKTFVYYQDDLAFGNGQLMSISLWFYPTDISSLSGIPYRILIYRFMGSVVNHFTIAIDCSDSKVYVTSAEAGVGTKAVSTNTVNMNSWNNVIFTYNNSTDTLTLYLNNVAGTNAIISDIRPYTTDVHMYLGGLPNLQNYRFTGYLDNFVFWGGKILTSTEVSNMWTRGTIA